MHPLFLLLLVLQPEDSLFLGRDLKAGEETVTTVCGSSEKNFILEVNGGGLIVADFNMDGHLDLVVVNGSTVERVREEKPALPSRVLLGDGNGNFAPGGEGWELPGGVWAMGGSAGDVDGDGDIDLFLTEWGANRLYINEGGRGFWDASRGIPEAGDGFKLSGLKGERWSTSCAFLDYNADGNLDLAVVNYLSFRLDSAAGPGDGCTWKGHDVMCGPEGMIPVHDQLFKGNGDGTFTDVSQEAGFRPDEAGFGLGIMTLDYDNDGDTDIYISNDSTPNHLWDNQGDGTFVEVGSRRGVSHDANGKEQAGMGIACADVDGDGRSDLFVTNFSGERNSFYRSSRKTGFREKADVARLGGPSIQRLGWGTGLADYNLDGMIDLVVVNGHVYPQADSAGTDTTYAQADQLFLGSADAKFSEQALDGGADRVSRAMVHGDFDEDGDLDLVVIQSGDAVRYYENRAAHDAAHHWLGIELVGKESNRAGIGARVTLVTGEKRRVAEVRSTFGYQAGCSNRLHFGLGATAKVDEIQVHWPSGRTQTLKDVDANQLLRIEEPAQ
ncbi:MAG: hypothetical protein ACI8X5_002434 [Planctomycetota bacterium]|jgi:hypothetical protein